eukprot:TRINITY_DN3880_c0_g1_i1.p1 TRINITY_DN3880_c0_g1~~TRINITY_DN3880_c0_g1_i1.p1  ORF type:complete len:640 (-),score=125.84 TRINITY_DN3880_c0_g1_i1:16-1908(-)
MQDFTERFAKKNSHIQKLFQLPPDETWIIDFTCSLEVKILRHGRLYITNKSLCFHSKIFGIKEVIPYENVKSIEKVRYALINPALIIHEENKRHLFASFLSREKTLQLILGLWEGKNEQIQVLNNEEPETKETKEAKEATDLKRMSLPKLSFRRPKYDTKNTSLNFDTPQTSRGSLIVQPTEVIKRNTIHITDTSDFHRQQILNEIITTEQDFISDIQILLDLYNKPLKEKGIITKPEQVTIFSNIEMILSINRELLEDFESSLTKSQSICYIGEVFIKKTDYLKLYTIYCNNHPHSRQTIKECIQSNHHFAEFLKECESDPRSRNQTLLSFLIKPIQRVCKYPLFLRELLKNTSQESQDYDILTKALQKIQTLCDYIEEKKLAYETGVEKLLQIQSLISGMDRGIVAPTRRFVKEGNVFVLETSTPSVIQWTHTSVNSRSTSATQTYRVLECQLFLFNNLLLLATPSPVPTTPSSSEDATNRASRIQRRASQTVSKKTDFRPLKFHGSLPLTENTMATEKDLPPSFDNINQIITSPNSSPTSSPRTCSSSVNLRNQTDEEEVSRKACEIEHSLSRSKFIFYGVTKKDTSDWLSIIKDLLEKRMANTMYSENTELDQQFMLSPRKSPREI